MKAVKLPASKSVLIYSAMFILFSLIPAELATAAGVGVLFVIISASRQHLPLSLLKTLTTPVILVFLGVVSGAIHGNDFFEIAKDAWYLLKIPLFLLVGFVVLKRPDVEPLFKSLILSGLIISLVHLTNVANNFETLSVSLDSFRIDAGRGYYATVVALIICLITISKNKKLNGNNLILFICILPLLVSLYYSYSRTLWLLLTLLGLASLGYNFRLKTKKNTVLVVILLIFLMLFFLLSPLYHNADSTTFMGKLFRTFDELKFENYRTDSDINQNWRGYESYKGWSQYLSGGPTELLFGQGFGTSIDLGLYINLGGTIMNKAPVLHNGYIYLLVKCGIVGLALYIALLISFLKSATKTSSFSGRMISALTIFVILETFTSSGLLGKSSVNYILILFGMLIKIQAATTIENSRTNLLQPFDRQPNN